MPVEIVYFGLFWGSFIFCYIGTSYLMSLRKKADPASDEPGEPSANVDVTRPFRLEAQYTSGVEYLEIAMYGSIGAPTSSIVSRAARKGEDIVTDPAEETAATKPEASMAKKLGFAFAFQENPAENGPKSSVGSPAGPETTPVQAPAAAKVRREMTAPVALPYKEPVFVQQPKFAPANVTQSMDAFVTPKTIALATTAMPSRFPEAERFPPAVHGALTQNARFPEAVRQGSWATERLPEARLDVAGGTFIDMGKSMINGPKKKTPKVPKKQPRKPRGMF